MNTVVEFKREALAVYDQLTAGQDELHAAAVASLVVYQALVGFEGECSITEIDPMTLSFVSSVIDADDFDELELDAEYVGLTLEVYLATNQAEMELHGRKRADENTVIEKRIGWVRWFETEQEANEWADSKVSDAQILCGAA